MLSVLVYLSKVSTVYAAVTAADPNRWRLRKWSLILKTRDDPRKKEGTGESRTDKIYNVGSVELKLSKACGGGDI